MTSLTKLSEKAFAIMAVCPEAKRFYGITVDQIRRNAFKFVWTFPIDKEKAHRKAMILIKFMVQSRMILNFQVALIAKANNFYFVPAGR